MLARGGFITAPSERALKDFVAIEGIAVRNFHDVDCRFPLRALVCVSGVSGSGKSTLVDEVIDPTLRRRLDRETDAVVGCRALRGAESLTAVRRVDQSPLGRNGRSNPATVTGVWDEIRRILAGTRTARLRGFGASRFSFLSAAGRCSRCRGKGELVHRLAVLPETRTPCPDCRGRRFNAQTLSIEFKGRNAADILDLTISEAAEFFASFPVVAHKLQTLVEMGLGYLTLGQPAPTLSGGEAQRIRLAAELGKWNLGPTLYLLDEPTQGLHAHDIARLLELLRKIIDTGHSVLLIEHHPGVLAAADWIIDLGPGAGAAGGTVVAQGPPAEIVRSVESVTGRVLRGLGNGIAVE
jgi:excinuclease ABC subunit A